MNPRVPTNEKKLWLKLLQLDLEGHPPNASILGVHLHAEPGVTSKVQLGLFSPQLPEPGRLDVTLAKITAIVGEGNVGMAVLDDTRRAGDFHIEPFSITTAEPPSVATSSLICVYVCFVRRSERESRYTEASRARFTFVHAATSWKRSMGRGSRVATGGTNRFGATSNGT